MRGRFTTSPLPRRSPRCVHSPAGRPRTRCTRWQRAGGRGARWPRGSCGTTTCRCGPGADERRDADVSKPDRPDPPTSGVGPYPSPMPLYRLEDPLPALDAPIVIAALDGWVDAGSAATSAVAVLAEHAARIATFDADALFDYRARRPV